MYIYSFVDAHMENTLAYVTHERKFSNAEFGDMVDEAMSMTAHMSHSGQSCYFASEVIAYLCKKFGFNELKEEIAVVFDEKKYPERGYSLYNWRPTINIADI